MKDEGGPTSTLVTISLAVFTVLFYSFVIFYLLPSAQLSKYTSAAQIYLDHSLPRHRIVDFSPIYLYVHVLVRNFFSNPNLIIQWLHIVLTAFSSVLTFQILTKFYGKPVAFAGAIAFVVDRSLIVYTHVFEPESLVVFFSLAFLFFVIRRSIRSSWMAGLCFGLGVLTRPNFLLTALFVPFYYRYRSLEGSKWIRSTMCFFIPFLLCLGGLWIRNTILLGYFSPFVMNPGTAFFEGNNPASSGLSSIYPIVLTEVAREYRDQPDVHHELYRMFSRKIAGKELSVPESNAYWTGKAIRYLRDYPAHALRLVTTKFFHIFHQYQWHDLANAYWNEQALKQSWIPTVPLSLISSMALMGIVLLRRNWKECLLMYALFLCQLVFMLLIYTSARQRVSLLFVMIFFACAALEFVLVNRSQTKSLAALLLLPLVIVFSLQTDWMKEENHLWDRIAQSNRFLSGVYRYRSEGKWNQAAQMSAISLSLAPWLLDSRRPANLPFDPHGFLGMALKVFQPDDFSSRFDLANLYLEAGKSAEAEKILKELIEDRYQLKRDQYQSSEPDYYLGRAMLLRGQKAEAIRMFQTALIRTPGDPWTLSFLFALTTDPQYRDRLFKYFDDIDAQFILGKALLATAKAEEASRCFEYVVRALPEYRPALVYLAAALGEAGKEHEGARRYREAIRMRADPVMLETQILGMFRRLAEQQPRNFFAQYSYGVVLRQFGHFQEALQTQRITLELDPANPDAAREIADLQKILNQPVK